MSSNKNFNATYISTDSKIFYKGQNGLSIRVQRFESCGFHLSGIRVNIYGFVIVEMSMGGNQSSNFAFSFNFRLERFAILTCTINSVWCVVTLRIIILVPVIKLFDSLDSVTILGKNLRNDIIALLI